MSKNNKKEEKTIKSILSAIFVIILLTIGATYAYLNFMQEKDFRTNTINAETGALNGGVTLTNRTSQMTLNLTEEQMTKAETNKVYYADINNSTETEKTHILASAIVNGNGKFSCDYTLNIAKDSVTENKDLFDAFKLMENRSTGQIVLTINDSENNQTVKDFYDIEEFPLTFSGTLSNLSSTNPKDITAQMYFVNNKDINQTFLSDKEISLTFSFSKFDCTSINNEPGE